MMTMEQIQEQKERLYKAERQMVSMKKLDEIQMLLEDGHFLVNIEDATSAPAGHAYALSLLLTDQEQAVLGKSIQVVLEFARSRMQKQLEEMSV